MKKIDEIFYKTAVKDTRGLMDEQSIKAAMQEYADWCLKQAKISKRKKKSKAL